ncbi:hypothetical protein F0919_00870 [Taibaiella lutea]|uniref:4-alpha-L-fucosyltransferase n=1 Tax=Taibaiella lutea TaxID=2608001 RepID=A0A5M6CPC2_9BACT|nr:TDP-N-acetylfucosamine:lipid II N-acetylfucosaminyltransferase [Taibaiella lutea]KAA5536250.1 hypothetical protein F0919_00870 [Taibaiella lutea]
MSSVRIAHIFSDEKFIDLHIKMFSESSFINTYFYVNKLNLYKGNNTPKLLYLTPNLNELFNLARKISSEYDILFVYNLNVEKAKIINAIDSSRLKIIWNFYGTEIYNMPSVRSTFFSLSTKTILEKKMSESFISSLKFSVKQVIRALRRKESTSELIYRAMKRIDYFTWYSEEEYNYLNELLKNRLPPFLKLSINNRLEHIVAKEEKKLRLLIGNSRSPFNNHIDILTTLENNAFNGEINIPFNYGSDINYANKLKEYTAGLNMNVNFLETFMKYDDYIDFINSHCAAIYNSYRQMALGNILIAIMCGLKVYLSIKNPLFLWFKNNNFIIFSIEGDLEADLKTCNVFLDKKTALWNINAHNVLTQKEHNAAFMWTIENMN